MSSKIAIVTGGNKGIGYAIVRGLCKQFKGIVYLTARDVNRGQKAVANLEKEGLKAKFHQLDITNPDSVTKFRDYIKKNYGGIDVLINNAAIGFYEDPDDSESVAIQAEQTLFVNYFSLVSTCDILFPILSKGARVINLSSSLGHLTLSVIPNNELRNKFIDPELTVVELSSLMQDYVDTTKKGNRAEKWGNVVDEKERTVTSYGVSKVGVSSLTRIQQRELLDRDIKVNSCHPGYVDTDMTKHEGVLTIDEGAVTPLFLALEAGDDVKGQFVWSDKTIAPWDGKQHAYLKYYI